MTFVALAHCGLNTFMLQNCVVYSFLYHYKHELSEQATESTVVINTID